VIHPRGLTALAFEQDEFQRRLGDGAFELTAPTISHHLKVLKQAGLIDSERRGTWVYYWINPAVLQRLSAILEPRQGAGLVPA
jgi:ArsR family transcriptional regulator